jgi:hypothetical protein
MKNPNDCDDELEREHGDEETKLDNRNRDEKRLQAKLDGDWASDGGQNPD